MGKNIGNVLKSKEVGSIGRIKKTLIIPLIVVMLITAVSPLVLAAAEDYITVTFDPGGTISLEVSPDTASFGSVVFESTNNDVSEGGGGTTAYTLWNNGTVARPSRTFSCSPHRYSASQLRCPVFYAAVSPCIP